MEKAIAKRGKAVKRRKTKSKNLPLLMIARLNIPTRKLTIWQFRAWMK